MPTDEALQKADAILGQMAVLWTEDQESTRQAIAQAIDDARILAEMKAGQERVQDWADAKRLIAWINDPDRRPAATAFSEGNERDIARLFERGSREPIWCWASVDAENGHRAHTWGFAHSKEDALVAAQTAGWLHSEGGSYTHVVVEKVTPGDIYGDKDEVWFALPEQGARVEPCEKPAKFERVVCFTIG